MAHDLARIPTGIPGLDTVLRGGFFEHDSYLVVGRAGTGKTVSCLQWLIEGARAGEECLYIALSEPADNIRSTARSFGWDVSGIEFVNLYPSNEDDALNLDTYHVFPPSDVEHEAAWDQLNEAVRERRPRRLAIDSVTELRFFSSDMYQFRRQVRSLVALLRQHEH